MSINLSGRALKRLRLPVVNYYSSAYQVMSAQAGDVNTRYLDVVLYDDRGDIDLSAYSKVYLQVQAYDGISPQMSEGWIDTERNRAVCRLTSSMLQYTGSKMPCNIWLVGTDADDEPMSLTSQTFYVMVYEGHGGADAEPSEDELTALQSAINDVVELEKTVGEAEANRQDNFRSVYIKYSFDANGYNYTDSWQQGQQYMGVANTPKEPEDATGYSWILISGGSSGGSAVTVVGKNGYGFYRLDGEYTADTTNVATEDIQRRADREVQAGDMLITPEGLIFVLDEYDADNDTQKVSYYTDIGGGDVSEEAIAAAVEMYMSENEIDGSGADDIDIVDSDGSYKLVLTKDGEHIGSGVNMPTYTAEDVGAAEKEHNHDEKYQPKGNYAAEGHDHDGKYQPVGNYLTEESDPTVPSWAKQPTKPTYTADEVNARPNTWMPTAEDVGARPSTWTPTASDVGADAIDTAATLVADHNAATDSHNDIRLLIQGLDARLTALADSDDTTLDQLSELVAYIKENRDLIGSITTDKVNVDDVINNLTTNDAEKPLSAAQGVALKALIDSLTTTKQTAEQVATAISNALKAYPTTTAMQTAISTALADYAKTDHNHDGTYIKQTELNGAVNMALETAKESGEFDGENGTSVTVSSVSESTESGGSNVVTFSDGKVLTVKNGEDGKDGMTQLTPLDAESMEWLEQNGEQGKFYVLPDNFIYAYRYYSEGGGEPLFTNLADPTSKAVPNTSDLSASENINGWWDGYRFDTAGNFIKSTVEGAFISNAFPLTHKAKIKIRGRLTADSNLAHNLHLCIYKSDTAYVTNKALSPLVLQAVSADANGNFPNTALNGSDYLVEERDPDDPEIVTYTYTVGYSRTGLGVTAANCVKGRIAGINLGEDTEIIVTYDDIAFTEPVTGYKWMSTGHAFVPADYEGEISELREDVDKLQEDMANIKQNGVASKGASFDYTAYGLPILYLNGDTAAMSKDTEVTLDYIFGERVGTCTTKWQGSSSLQYPKKNYTVKFDTAFEAVEGWGAQKKYCLKANFMDFSHSRNLCSAKLWGQIVKSRATPDARLAALPNGGAVDGFPVVIVINDKYMGLYTFNIPKDGWLMGMGSGEQEAILCADGWSSANQGCLFLNEAACDGSDFEIEYATDEDNTTWVVESLNRLINACLASDGTDLDTTIAQYVDIDSAIDYLIFVPLIHGADCVKRNYLLGTYDGVKWFFSAYDMDSTYGITWDGGYFKEAAGAWKAAVGASGEYPVRSSMMSHKLLQLLWTHKQDRVKARYAELRGGVMSEANVAHEFMEFAAAINKAYFDEEPKVWPTIPATGANNASQIVTHYMIRTPRIDKDFGL